MTGTVTVAVTAAVTVLRALEMPLARSDCEHLAPAAWVPFSNTRPPSPPPLLARQVSTVTYLTESGGPTLILNQTFDGVFERPVRPTPPPAAPAPAPPLSPRRSVGRPGGTCAGALPRHALPCVDARSWLTRKTVPV